MAKSRFRHKFCQTPKALLFCITMLCCLQKKWMGSCDYYVISFRSGNLGCNTLGTHFQVLYSSLSWGPFSRFFTSIGQVRHLLSNTYGEVVMASSFCLHLIGNLKRCWVVGNHVIGHHFYCNSALKQFFRNDKVP